MTPAQRLGSVTATRKKSLGGALNDYVCGGGVAEQVWVAQAAVREALHVPAEANFFDGDNGDGMTYVLTEPNLMPFYVEVRRKSSARDVSCVALRMVILHTPMRN